MRGVNEMENFETLLSATMVIRIYQKCPMIERFISMQYFHFYFDDQNTIVLGRYLL